MPNSTRETVLCRYHYDPLDRQNGCTALQQPAIQRFHCKSRLATEIQGSARWSIFQQDDQLLAQHSHLDAKVTATLLTTDQQRSVLNALEATQPNPLAYTPYGHRPAKNSLLSLLGFNGERPDPVTGHYHLGNGYRQFNPVLMRFNSPDSWSPFGEGGLNAYVYCADDPVNQEDRDGHAPKWITQFFKFFRSKRPKTNFGVPSKSAPITKPPVSTLFTGERFSKLGINEGKLIVTQSSQTHLKANQVSFYENDISIYQTVTTADKNTLLTHIIAKPNIPPEHAEFIKNVQFELNQGSLSANELEFRHPEIQKEYYAKLSRINSNLRKHAESEFTRRNNERINNRPDPNRFMYRSGF